MRDLLAQRNCSGAHVMKIYARRCLQILVQILRHIDSAKDLVRLACTCKHLKSVIPTAPVQVKLTKSLSIEQEPYTAGQGSQLRSSVHGSPATVKQQLSHIAATLSGELELVVEELMAFAIVHIALTPYHPVCVSNAYTSAQCMLLNCEVQYTWSYRGQGRSRGAHGHYCDDATARNPSSW